MTKYGPVTEHLSSLPLSQRSLSLGFAAIEKLLGVQLPKTATADRTWWANTAQSNHAKAWLSAGWKVDKVDFSAQKVEFVRQSSEAAPDGSKVASAYKRLHAFLDSIPDGQVQLALRFEEIESVMGRSLPPTALQDRTWWANAAEYSPSKDWLSAGWKVESVFLHAATVVFRRSGAATLDSVRACVKRFLGDDKAGPVPDARRAAQWITLCRRVEWYFEATVLFERGGISFASLTETAQSEVEEDIETCRRELDRYKAQSRSVVGSRTGRS
ncbi:MAG: hypothetical protein K2X36_05115 [Microbacteriaceae bacterium]|jgi:hypothetical protein|nr:hypothetical protein [Microbacteriaceae bacterium]